MRLTTIQLVLFAVFGFVYVRHAGVPLVTASWTHVVGLVLAAAGAVLMAVAYLQMGDAFRILPEPRAGAALVTRGVYSRLRHPIYTGIVVAAIGLALERPHPWVVATGVLLVAFHAFKGAREEQLLTRRHGDTYTRYKERTRGVLLNR